MLDAETEKHLETLPVTREILCQITSKMNDFKTDGMEFKLFWKAKIINENEEKNGEGTERDLNDLN